ncbi:M23 family metallopeptidase [Streptomyces filamentosus]|uniref:M23 family metallopeptidase n=1 Tax=Streptomyces filamentosus TaxID=67294 RepID=UPI00123B87EF|nr:M23 family metallopeptidase [Streptomyces filamentosus]KAA6218713.1 M23 family peptidase [Streptomyces filamentosus]
MASNTPVPEAPFDPFGGRGAAGADDPAGSAPGAYETASFTPAPGEWNPTEGSLRAESRSGGRHRVVKQRSNFARSSTVLGVGVIAAVGAGGLATAQDKPPVAISLPDLPDLGLPDAKDLPGVGALLADDEDGPAEARGSAPAAAGGTAAKPLTSLTYAAPADTATAAEAERTVAAADAGEALRARILQQAEQQQQAAVDAEKEAAEKAAAEKAVEAAAQAKAEADAVAKAEAVAKAKAEAERLAAEKAEAERIAAEKAEAERLAKLAASYSMPLSSYTLTSTYMQSGSMWSSGYHTGLDFAAPTGTPLKAVHGGTIKSATYSGSYGYRVVLELEDGTEVWYCHLSSMTVAAGQTVATGETIGRVGATGNVTGPHLHMEVHTPDGSGIDPAEWLRSKGLTV